MFDLIRQDQTRRYRLVSTHNGIDRTISKGSWKGELRDRQFREVDRFRGSAHSEKRSGVFTAILLMHRRSVSKDSEYKIMWMVSF